MGGGGEEVVILCVVGGGVFFSLFPPLPPTHMPIHFHIHPRTTKTKAKRLARWNISSTHPATQSRKHPPKQLRRRDWTMLRIRERRPSMRETMSEPAQMLPREGPAARARAGRTVWCIKGWMGSRGVDEMAVGRVKDW